MKSSVVQNSRDSADSRESILCARENCITALFFLSSLFFLILSTRIFLLAKKKKYIAPEFFAVLSHGRSFYPEMLPPQPPPPPRRIIYRTYEILFKTEKKTLLHFPAAHYWIRPCAHSTRKQRARSELSVERWGGGWRRNAHGIVCSISRLIIKHSGGRRRVPNPFCIASLCLDIIIYLPFAEEVLQNCSEATSTWRAVSRDVARAREGEKEGVCV